jgi:hypothetical protein
MADLPITSDEGATPIVINDPTTTANVANVKAASTAAVAADNSLVVALSPNSPVPTGTNKIGVTGVAQGSTTSGEYGDLVQGAVTTAAPSYTTGQTSPLSLTTVGNLRVDGSSVTQPVSGTVAVTQSTSPWVVSLTSTTITGTVTVAGAKTNNNAAPGATNLGVLPAIANAATQTWTEGDQVLESVDLSGRQRIRGVLSNNSAAPDTDGLMELTALANAASPSWTEGNLVLLSEDLSGNLRVKATSAGPVTPGTVASASNLAGGQYNSIPPTLTTGQQAALQLNSSGALNVNITGSSGNSTVNQGTAAATTAGWPIIGGNIAESTAAWTSATAINTAVTMTVTGYTSVLVTLNQTTTITGGVVTFEVSDTTAFTNAYSVDAVQINSPSTISATYTLVASTNQAFYVNVRGAAAFRVRLSTVITGTGTVNVGVAANTMPGDPVVGVTGTVAISPSGTASTYSATSGSFTPGATPTDIVTLIGSATKTIRILRLELSTTQTTLGMNTWFLVKRSTANSGGTSTNPTVVPFDSNNATPTAVMAVYTANPTTLGTLVGDISSIKLVSAPTVGGTPPQDYWGYDFTNSGTQQGLVLRGTSQVFALNFNGAALPAGLSVNVNIMWSEQ